MSQTEDQNVSRVPPEHNTTLLLQIEEMRKKNIFEVAFIFQEISTDQKTYLVEVGRL